jgi:hypothetical protein
MLSVEVFDKVGKELQRADDPLQKYNASLVKIRTTARWFRMRTIHVQSNELIFMNVIVSFILHMW